MLTRKYTVHSCARTPFPIQAQFNGKPVEAMIDGLVVEFVADDGGKSQTEAFVPDDMDAALAEFTVGAAFTVTYQKDA